MIRDKFASKSTLLSFEVFPPKKEADVSTIYEALDEFKYLQPDFISVTYGAGGTTIENTFAIANYIQNQCRIEALFFCMLALSHTVAGICRGAGKAMVPMLVMLGVWCVFRIAYITTAMHFCHDIRLLFWAYPITWTISGAIFSLYYRRSNWLTVPKEA